MTETQSKQIQDVEVLLAEKKKYEQWMVQLESRKATTAAHVFTRVQQDYQARLAETQTKLAAESGVVQKLVSDLATSLQSHEQQIRTKQDERAEAELRASVGEFSESDWGALRDKLDAAISSLSGTRDSISTEHDALRTLLNEAIAPSPSTPMAAVAAAATTAPPRRPSGELARTETGAGVPAKKTEVDELAFLRSVLGRSTPYTNTGQQQAVSAQPAAEPVARRESSAGRVPSGSGSAPVAPATAGAAPHDEVRTGLGVSTTPRGNDAVKTLKCQECGTMNFPTEWYCERCGGELSAF